MDLSNQPPQNSHIILRIVEGGEKIVLHLRYTTLCTSLYVSALCTFTKPCLMTWFCIVLHLPLPLFEICLFVSTHSQLVAPNAFQSGTGRSQRLGQGHICQAGLLRTAPLQCVSASPGCQLPDRQRGDCRPVWSLPTAVGRARLDGLQPRRPWQKLQMKGERGVLDASAV